MVYLKEAKELRTICEEILEGKECPQSVRPSIRCVTNAADYELHSLYGDEEYDGHVFFYPNNHVFVDIERTKHSDRHLQDYCDNGMFGACDKVGCGDCQIRWTISLGHRNSRESFRVKTPLPVREVLTSPHPGNDEVAEVIEAIQEFAAKNGIEEKKVDDATRLLDIIHEDGNILATMNSSRVSAAYDKLPPLGQMLVIKQLLKNLDEEQGR